MYEKIQHIIEYVSDHVNAIQVNVTDDWKSEKKLPKLFTLISGIMYSFIIFFE